MDSSVPLSPMSAHHTAAAADAQSAPSSTDDSAALAEYRQFMLFQSFVKQYQHQLAQHPMPHPVVEHAVTIAPHPADVPRPPQPGVHLLVDAFNHETLTNPSPIGLCAFALTTFILSVYNTGMAIGTSESHGVVMGVAFAYGGIVQFAAGLLECKSQNPFGALAFCSYGGFWISLACLYVKSFDFLSGYAGAPTTLDHAMGVYMLGWAIFSLLMFFASFRTSRVLCATIGFVFLTFLFLTISKFAASAACQQVAGAFGMAAAFLAWYLGFAGLITKEQYGFELPVWPMRRKVKQLTE